MIGFKSTVDGRKRIPVTCQKQIRKGTSVSAQSGFVSAQKQKCISVIAQKQLMSAHRIFLQYFQHIIEGFKGQRTGEKRIPFAC
jgi:riboflavin synthase